MRFKNALKKFTYETFRPHSQEEYAELFTRGRDNGKNSYPWFYARVFLISLLLFTVMCIGYSASEINFIVVAVAGGIFADLTFIVLLYELYPERDLPLLTPILALFAGGVLSSAFIYVFYGIANYRADYANQAWTAFVEETGKAITTVILLLVIKKKKSYVGLLIGAAVGGGYSAFENMWYMYTHGLFWSSGLSQAIETGLWRALGTPFSHAAWAAAFGWAISLDKPWKKWQPYAVFAFNYVMHFFVNFPLMSQFAGWNGYSISAVTGVLSITLLIVLVLICRGAFSGKAAEKPPKFTRGYSIRINGVYNEDNGGVLAVAKDGGAEKYKLLANVFAATAIFCLSFTFLGPTCVFAGYSNYKSYYYDDWNTVINIVQGEYALYPDNEREYIEYYDLSQNYSYTWADGELTSVIQREQYGEYFYRFYYGYTRYYNVFIDEDGNYFVTSNGKKVIVGNVDDELLENVRVWELQSVDLELNDSLYSRRTIRVYRGGELAETYYFYNLNPNVTYISVLRDGSFEVEKRETVPLRAAESVAFTCVFGTAFIGCGIAYILYKIKIRRYQNVE